MVNHHLEEAQAAEPSEPRDPHPTCRPTSRPRLRRSRLDLWPYALIAFLYLATSPYHQGLNNPNEMVRVYMTKALVDSRTPAIDTVVRDWGGVDDKAIREGKLYSSKAPLQSLVGVPAYLLGRPLLARLGINETPRSVTTVLRILGSALFGIVFAGLILRFARRRALELGAPRALGTGLGLSIALGTMLYPYAITFTGHLLAAAAAGGTFFAALAISRAEPRSPKARRFALLAGSLAATAPFAEYPSALVAGPALLGALAVASTWPARIELAALFALGGALPFAFGLWAHADSWGSPFKTGYSFLENHAYVELHGQGFFGVSLPKAEAFAGALFSPGTGLFFFSPLMLVGLAAMVSRAFRRDTTPGQNAIPRALAIAGLAGVVLSVLFISGHRGWRGGWTVGPRYIISVAPLLGLFAIEALAVPAMRSFAAALGAVSIVTTGFAAALYPHLSDVFTNPLKSFVVPSYLRGEMSYGIAYALGLHGHAANLVHVLPLLAAVVFVAVAGVSEAETRRRRAIAVASAFTLGTALVAVIPERDPTSATRENERLWGFWEPKPRTSPTARFGLPEAPGLVFRASQRFEATFVERVDAEGVRHPCLADGPQRCRYGVEPWQHFGPESIEVGGEARPLLYIHPVKGSAVRAAFPIPPVARRAVLRYGLSDGSVASDNPESVNLRVLRGSERLEAIEVPSALGLASRDLTLTATTAPLIIELTTGRDGARVFAFDLELYRD